MKASSRLARSIRSHAAASGGILALSLLNAAVVAVNPGLVLLLLLAWVAVGGIATLVLIVWAALSKTHRLRRVGFLALVLAVIVLTPWVVRRVGWPLERMAYVRATHRAAPIIAAIDKYTRATGKLPSTLDELVPAYIESIPSTGLVAFSRVEYEVSKNARVELFWYDLGDRHGRPMRGLWVYPDGPPAHAILGIEVNPDGRVIGARGDRMPDGLPPTPFDDAGWRDRREDRMAMVGSLRGMLSGISLDQAKALLGEPDGRRVMNDTPWELRIPCPHGVLNWDVLLYWPTGNYPQHTHGGWPERLGDWAYIHE